MIRLPAFGAAVAALLLLGPALGAADDPFKLASVDEVATMLGQPDVKIYDANPREVFVENRLPGAIFVEKPIANLAKQLPKDPTTRLVFYCRNPK
jgi:hypothetical protein